MRVALTGATGFLGSHIAETFVRHGHEIVAAVRPASRIDFLKTLGVTLVPASLENLDQLHQAFTGADAVIHAAAKVAAYGHWHEFEQATITGTRHALQAATNAGVSRFLYVSSVGVYGWPRADGQPFDETAPYGQTYRWNYYARAKIAAEQLVRAATIPTVILRPTIVFGPHDRTTISIIGTALRNGEIRWLGDATNLLSLVYASDFAEAVVLAATRPEAAGQIFNIGAEECSVTQRHYFTRICELLALPVPVKSVSTTAAYRLAFAGECIAHLTGFRIQPPLSRHSFMLFGGHRRYSTAKLRTTLGWKPLVDFEEGIQRTVQWYRAAA